MAAPDKDSSHKPDTTDVALVYDNFYSPENHLFYSKNPYKPLSTPDHEIRLLKLLPSGDNGVFSFTLLDNVPLPSVNNHFTALSYSAGNPRNTSRFLVNGLEFNAFANLGHALREVISFWKKEDVVLEQQLLWIDQICIDQSNPQERSHQVNMMRNIYASAERVLVCLARKKCSGVGMQFAIGWRDTLVHGLPAEDVCPEMGLTDDSIRIAREKAAMSYFKSYQQSGIWREAWADFVRLMKSSWWRRCWICQEFIVARDAEFLYGGLSMNWKDFAIVINHMRQCPWFFGEGYLAPLFGPRLLLDKKHNLNQLGETRTGELKVWLNYGRNCKSSDARDKIFAFLGLASEEYNITPDYSASTTIEEVLIQVATRIIAVDKNLDLLSYSAGERKYHPVFNRLPTWVPGWTDQRRRPDPIHNKSFSPKPPRVEDGIKLMAEGFQLDGQESKLAIAFGMTEDKEQDPSLNFRVWWSLEENEGLWYFPYTSVFFKLEKVEFHWLLVRDIPLSWQSGQPNAFLKLFEMVRKGDVAWWLEQGLKKETIEIR